MGFSASPTMKQLQDPTVREDAALGLRTTTGSNTGTATSKLCAFGEFPYPLWARFLQALNTRPDREVLSKWQMGGHLWVFRTQHLFPLLLKALLPSSAGGLSPSPLNHAWARDPDLANQSLPGFPHSQGRGAVFLLWGYWWGRGDAVAVCD